MKPNESAQPGAPSGAVSEVFAVDRLVSFWNVDRDNLLSLRSLFAFMQEAAIRHADQCGSGARAKQERNETWVLQRMAVRVERYPRYDEALRVTTWSSGIRAFKGFRDFRVHCGREPVASASSVWLYLDLARKAICRVPRDVADGFPARPGEAFFPDLERLRLGPVAGGPIGRDISVRYSDVDGNGHVNNTAYFDYLQTALAAEGFPPRPRTVQVQFLREITPAVEHVRVSLERRGQEVAFGIGGGGGAFAQGAAAY